MLLSLICFFFVCFFFLYYQNALLESLIKPLHKSVKQPENDSTADGGMASGAARHGAAT